MMRTLSFCSLLAAFAVAGTAAASTSANDKLKPGYDVDKGLNVMAKATCSGVYVSGRNLRDVLYESSYFLMPPLMNEQQRPVAQMPFAIESVTNNDETKTITIRLQDGTESSAEYRGDLGCRILPAGAKKQKAELVTIEKQVPDRNEPWPLGERLEPGSEGTVDETRLQEALSLMTTGELFTHSFLVMHKGKILAEHYDHGMGQETPAESWSMGKSLTAILFGRLVQMQGIDINSPVPIESWQKAGDGRQAITYKNLLNMSSGLTYSGFGVDKPPFRKGVPDHIWAYAGVGDIFADAISRPLEFEPNTHGRYRNIDPHTIGYLIRQHVEQSGGDYISWPQRVLFDPLGIDSMVLETDIANNFLLSGYDFGTARDWARLSLLLLQDGVWQGERLLPEGWVDFMFTPAEAWPQKNYGAFVWLNNNGYFPSLPASTVYFSGSKKDRVVIIPEHDLVVIKLAHNRSLKDGLSTMGSQSRLNDNKLDQAISLIIKGIKS